MSDDIILDMRNGEPRKIIIIQGQLDDTFQTEVHLSITDEGLITDFFSSEDSEGALELVGTLGNTWGELFERVPG